MKILVVCQDYPRPDNKSVFAFVHSRSLYYLSLGHSVEVLSFQCSSPYQWDGVSVFPEKHFTPELLSEYSLTFIHMPNIRNGLRFLIRFRNSIVKPCLVVHGHELLDWVKYVPRKYSRTMRDAFADLMQAVYDKFKVWTWRQIVKWRVVPNLKFIFVSQWMKSNAEQSLGIDFDTMEIPSAIIHNPIHPVFDLRSYDPEGEKVADFVTIRSFDHPKYGIDIVREIAVRHPQYTFHVYGEGSYFERHPPPPNMKVFKERFTQTDLPERLNKYRCALLPTRVDAQGVLMCEIAAMGMPILASDLDVCKEMIGDFPNAAFFNNQDLDFDIVVPPAIPGAPKSKFLVQNTVAQELSFASTYSPVYVNGNSSLPA